MVESGRITMSRPRRSDILYMISGAMPETSGSNTSMNSMPGVTTSWNPRAANTAVSFRSTAR